jgi:hypothetical protein
VVTDAESVVVAYVTLSMTGIDRSSAPAAVAKQSPDPVPALLIGRLAVDRSVSGLGVGTALVAHVLATAVDLNQWAACRAVVVTALDESARSWWEQLRFHRSTRPITTRSTCICSRLTSRRGSIRWVTRPTAIRLLALASPERQLELVGSGSPLYGDGEGRRSQCAWSGPDGGGVPANARF